jgi:long-chain acyl-CoA synthetase
MRGYLNDADATALALRRHADDRIWLHTGDLGRMDEDGFFYFTVRLKRMIKSSGFNVHPAQVEAVLREHAAVADACVIGVPDASQVERVVAWVVPTAGVKGDSATADALIAYCRERLIKWSCPREVYFLDSLPTTRVGKIDYRTLGAARLALQEATTS